MDYLEKEWYRLGLELEKSGDYARAIDSFYKAGATDKLRNLAVLPEQIRNRLDSKSTEDLQILINDLSNREDAICNDGNDLKTLESIAALKDIAFEILDEHWGIKKTEAS